MALRVSTLPVVLIGQRLCFPDLVPISRVAMRRSSGWSLGIYVCEERLLKGHLSLIMRSTLTLWCVGLALGPL